jgi:radical SAM superfamily enzyme YgiQ (UPF0313 family)
MGLKHRYDYESVSARLKESEHWYATRQIAGKINLAVIYPNLYSLGMSNLGFLTVHRIASSISGIGVERFFPALEANIPLKPPFYSFETGRPLSDFDILLFSFSFEGDFDQIPGIFSALGIPVETEKRNRRHPFLVAGGAAISANPAALSRIFDVLVPGEAETTLEPLLTAFLEKEISHDSARKIPGVWVPVLDHEPESLTRHCDIDLEPAWSHIVSPYNAFGGSHIIEIMRGCPRNCAFCLARVIYQPVRKLSKSHFSQWLDRMTICKDIGLVAPSLFDHPEIEEIFAMLLERKIRIRNSSVKWEKLNDRILAALRASEARSLTLAPETGSEKLRNAMNKPMNEDRFFRTLEKIINSGFDQIKLYFIAGLPDETDKDIENTVEFIKKAISVTKNGNLNIAFSIFVPKRNTLWENEKFLTLSEIKRKIRYIKALLKKLPVQLKVTFESPNQVCRQIELSRTGPELAEQYALEAEICKENRLFSKNQFSCLEF